MPNLGEDTGGIARCPEVRAEASRAQHTMVTRVHPVSGQKTRARRSPLAKAVTCPCTLSMHIALYGILRRTGEAGDHRKAVRGLTGAVSPPPVLGHRGRPGGVWRGASGIQRSNHSVILWEETTAS